MMSLITCIHLTREVFPELHQEMRGVTVLLGALAGLGAAAGKDLEKGISLEEAHRLIRENVQSVQEDYQGQALCDKYTCCE